MPRPEDKEDDGPFVVPPPVSGRPEMSVSQALQIRRLLSELRQRDTEAIRLYEPLPHFVGFHESKARVRLIVGGNRSGKTLCGGIELARALTGQDPYRKYPAKDGKAILVGLEEKNLADPFFEILMRPGAFKVIKDAQTGLMRAFNPVLDAGRESEAEPCAPLIPPRLVSGIGWDKKAQGIPRNVKLKTGWEIFFYSSKSAPPQGIKINLWWIDEECQNESWYEELTFRCLDRSGRGYWTATPQLANPQFLDLHLKAEEGSDFVQEWHGVMSSNPHISQQEKDIVEELCTTDEQRRVRIHGEFLLNQYKVYPEFSSETHCDHEPSWMPPPNWSRFVAVDPGRQVAAGLLLAVPPPNVGDYVVLYDEVHVKHCDAEKFAAALKAKSDHMAYEAFIIDSHAGRIHEMGSGGNVERQYREAFKRHGLSSRITGYGFVPGNDDPKAGIEAVRQWLRVRDDGKPKLRVVRGKLRHFMDEMARYHYRRVKGLPTDDVEKRNDHAVDCLRYLAAFRPRWHRPRPAEGPKSDAVRRMEKKRARARERAGDVTVVILGPGNG